MADLRTLVIVLGDQLNLDAAAFDGFEPAHDAVWMAEVSEESTHVWSSQQRCALFLSAMRHFADALRGAGRPLHYTRLDPTDEDAARGPSTLAGALSAAVQRLRPQHLVVTAPGDWRVLKALEQVAKDSRLALEIREDRYFYSTVREFSKYAQKTGRLRLEYFYRDMRRRHDVLMEGDAPAGGQWNFDADNRGTFGAGGPSGVPARACFEPDAVTREVLDLVATRFGQHPGTVAGFAWPVTRAEALVALRRFVAERLPCFGRYQDAMWSGEAWGYHSHLAAALNLKLLNPREVVAAAEAAYAAGTVPLQSAEGFIRQILGWREYVRGIYWTRMPAYLESNALGAHEPLPEWYWTADTDMACLRDVIGQTLRHGYAHHIQRLMVTGLYALLLGVAPMRVHEWYLAVYVDAVEWAELPNVIGMSQYADGGVMASKPYVASGKYIERMSNLCKGCRYDPGQRAGPAACPFTTLYWDFLMRHQETLAANQRMSLQLKNLQRIGADDRAAIVARAAAIRRGEVGS
jgi:deoxyribodipyrimidine photolyase-related protein